MKIYKVTLTVAITIAALMIGETGQAQTNSHDFSDYKPKSPNKATQYSLMGTLLPIAAGIAWWQIDRPKTRTETHNPGRWSYTTTYTDEPNRTIPVMLIVSGVVLGPSVGYFYGDYPERGVTGILIRVGTGALTAVAASAAAKANRSDGFMDFSELEAAITAGAIGSGIIIIESIVDIALVSGTIEKENIKRSRQSGINATLLPKYFADSGAGGVQLNITF